MSEPGGPDPATLAVYDRDAPAYAAWSTARSPRDWLARFMARLPAGGSALDLGCGAGWAAAEMIAAGFAVRALDASEGLVKQARKSGVPAEKCAFADLKDVETYDGVWASYSLLHAPRAEMGGHLARIRCALKPGGTLYLGLKRGEGEARDTLGRLYVYWSEAAIRAELAAAGLVVDTLATARSTGWDGAEETMMDLFARA